MNETESGTEGSDDSFERIPILFLDVNLGGGRMERLTLYEGDDPEDVTKKFATKFNLDKKKRTKLFKVVKNQMKGLLTRIEEEETEVMSKRGLLSNLLSRARTKLCNVITRVLLMVFLTTNIFLLEHTFAYLLKSL